MNHIYFKQGDNLRSVNHEDLVSIWRCANCGMGLEAPAFATEPPVSEKACVREDPDINVDLVRRLNKLCEDPIMLQVLDALIELRTPVPDGYDHPNVVQVEKGREGSGIYEVGLLGVLNGLRDYSCHGPGSGYPDNRIAAIYKKNELGREVLVGFTLLAFYNDKMVWP